MKDFERLIKLCENKNVYIQTHNFPDADAIASAFGLQNLLKYKGIESVLCYEGKIDRYSASKMLDAFPIKIYSYQQLKDTMSEEDIIICVDSQKDNGNISDFPGKEIACIDHHPVFIPRDYEYSRIIITGACASIIAKYYQELEIEPDVDTATALLYGMKMDTLHFTRGVKALDIEMYGYLFPFSDNQKLSYMEKNNMELQDLRAYKDAIEHIYVSGNIGIASVHMPCPDGLVASISDLLLSMKELSVSIVYCFREDGIKFSVRSEIPEIHAGILIRDALEGLGDGGGHCEMAGGIIKYEHKALLGKETEQAIRKRFLDILNVEK